ncbi:hypothetical protein fugu_015906 [Takifugu bimaculatus]|uniref:Uncharacterized protein n=1 Tax=Takifugu bimaculatus TaxID=433685 RepID=A0A4Z2BVK0_9TELE|nr:hypothetical protein fugu_015906 [Takifugu bimaculatus]
MSVSTSKKEQRSLKEHQPLPKVQEPLYSFSTLTKLPSHVKISQPDSNLPTSCCSTALPKPVPIFTRADQQESDVFLGQRFEWIICQQSQCWEFCKRQIQPL